MRIVAIFQLIVKIIENEVIVNNHLNIIEEGLINIYKSIAKYRDVYNVFSQFLIMSSEIFIHKKTFPHLFKLFLQELDFKTFCNLNSGELL